MQPTLRPAQFRVTEIGVTIMFSGPMESTVASTYYILVNKYTVLYTVSEWGISDTSSGMRVHRQTSVSLYSSMR